MNLRTRSLYSHAGQYFPVDIFGYVSHGTPGIEIVGMGKHSRAMKEKFVYLSRVRQLRLPKRRFVICVEGEIEGKKFKDEEYRYLEFPMLLVLWSLSGHLPFSHLDDCISTGKVSIDGDVECMDLQKELQNKLFNLFAILHEEEMKIIAPDKMEISDDFYHLSLEGIMKSLELQNDS